MLKIRCKMARLNNEETASEELNFKTLTKDGEVRNPTIKEEFVQVIKEFKIPSILFRRSTFQTQVKWLECTATSLVCTNMRGRKLTS